MDSDPSLPSARVVREAGTPIAEPSRPMGEHLRRLAAPMREHGREALRVFIGLWPLTAIMAVAGALIWAAGLSGSP